MLGRGAVSFVSLYDLDVYEDMQFLSIMKP